MCTMAGEQVTCDVAEAAGQQLSPVRDGVVYMEELPVATDRTAAYRLIRQAGPVARDAHGAYLITGSDGAAYALRHPELFSSKRAFDSLGSPFPIVPVASDPPEHTRYRQVLRPFFSVRGTARWVPMVHALATQLIDSFIDRGECDVVADLAVPLPCEVFLTLFGLPLADRDRLIAWKDAVLDAVGVSGVEPASEASIVLAAELYEYLVAHIARKRESGGDDLLGQLATDTSQDRLTDDELLGLSFLFVLAGLDTVSSALSSTFAALAGRPELRSQIVADPAVIGPAIEELLRVEGPVVIVPRVATQDVQVGGRTIPADASVAIAIAAANRDPADHEDPDSIDFERRQQHFAFGGGPHACLGAHLARLEMRVVLEEWHRRIPEYWPGAGASDRVEWPSSLVGLDRLPLVFPPGGGTAGDPLMAGTAQRTKATASARSAEGELCICIPRCAGSGSGRSGSCFPRSSSSRWSR
jgi:cytochrome P450